MIIASKYNGYCNKCHYTFFKNEEIKWNGKGTHLDCVEALGDTYPRRLNPKYKTIYGSVSRSRLRKMLEDNSLGQRPSRTEGAG